MTQALIPDELERGLTDLARQKLESAEWIAVAFLGWRALGTVGEFLGELERDEREKTAVIIVRMK